MKFLSNINLNQNELQNVRIQNLASDPATPKAGQFWFNTASGVFKYYDGTNTDTFVSLSALLTKLSVTGILKGDGEGGLSAAVAGTDYGYAALTGTSAPTTSTVGAVGQHYLDTAHGVEYVCKAVTTSGDPAVTTYTWIPVTVDISGKQDTITVSGIVKGDGSGNLSAAQAGTDFGAIQLSGNADPTTSTVGIVGQHYVNTSTGDDFICTAVGSGDPVTYTWKPVVNATAGKALVSDANGKVEASSVTATELGYLSGATGNIQSQLDNIPKLNYLDGVSCTVSDGATQTEINTAAVTAISTAYSTPSKYDAVNVAITFTPSDRVKDGLYMYNGSAWVFQYYTTTGIQLANGTTAGLIEEAASDSDLTLVNGVATVNQATKLRTARSVSIEGDYNDGTDHTDGIDNASTLATFDGTGNLVIKITGIKPEMLNAAVPVAKGGTGKSSITEGYALVGNSSGGFDEVALADSVEADNDDDIATIAAVKDAAGSGLHKYTVTNAALTPSSGVCSWVVTHSLNTRAITVDIAEAASPYEKVLADIEYTSADSITIKIVSDSNIAAGTYQVTVIG